MNKYTYTEPDVDPSERVTGWQRGVVLIGLIGLSLLGWAVVIWVATAIGAALGRLF